MDPHSSKPAPGASAWLRLLISPVTATGGHDGLGTYCPQCGRPYDDHLGGHRCPHCGGLQHPLQLPTAYGRLWTDLLATLPQIGLSELSWDWLVDGGRTATMPPSSWDPGPPPRLTLRLGRPDTETCLYLLHELGHAVLHPSGEPHDHDAYLRDPEPEERLVNAAANCVCELYGIGDYNETVSAMGHTFCEDGPPSADAYALADAVLLLLDHPSRRP